MKGADQFAPRSRARRRALQAVYQWQMTGQETNNILMQFRQAQDFTGVDVEFFEQLLRGVASEAEALDAVLQPYLDRPMAEVDVMERVVLRMGAWELLHCPEVPYKVVLDEAVDLAHRFGSEQGHSYVNAVLDKAAKKLRAVEVGMHGNG